MRYQKIHSQIWNDEKFTALTPAQQRLFLYILTCPHGNIIGVFVLKPGYIRDDLQYSPKDLNKDLKELVETGLIEYDFSTSVILIKKFLKHNPLTNPNQIKAANKMLKELPKTHLIHKFIEVLPEALKEELVEVLLKPEYISVSGSVSDSMFGSVKEEGVGGEERLLLCNKKKYLEFVHLTDDEYDKLRTQFGEKEAKERIQNLNDGIGSKGYKYKSHYHTILNWWRKEQRAQGGLYGNNGNYDGTGTNKSSQKTQGIGHKRQYEGLDEVVEIHDIDFRENNRTPT